jgi:hypothetical protein
MEGEMSRKLGIVLAAATLGACGEPTGMGSPTVAVVLESRAATGASASLVGADGGSLVVDGTNGMLRLDTAHAILDRFELKRVERIRDCDVGVSSDPCEKFRAPPSLVRLPLADGPRTVVSGEVPPGAYDRLRFEIEDLDDDESDPVMARQIEELFAAIRAQYPDWPRKASMRVVGEFTPQGGDPRPFRAYLDARIRVRLEFATPFVVARDDVGRTITVEMDPRDWFVRADGTVIDLAEHDFPSTGQLLEFRVRVRDGFKRVRHDG